jgi:alpha-amylase
MKGNVVTILTNIGSPVRFESKEPIQALKCGVHSRKIRAHSPIHPGLAASQVPSKLKTIYQGKRESKFDKILSILSCKQWAVGSNGTVEVQYTKGGTSVILVPDDILDGSGLCGGSIAGKAKAGGLSNGSRRNASIPIIWLLLLFYVGASWL